uniref:UBC core domain-containing protein n=1 Tax=Panagrolaimus davidi TaxID=227884 RepID=A0A914PWS9_9BILA
MDRPRPPNFGASPFYNVSLFINPEMAVHHQRIRTSQDILFGNEQTHQQPQHLNRLHQSAPLPSLPRPNIKTILSGGIKEYVEKNNVTNPFFAAKRVMNDLTELEEKPLAGIYVGPANDHILELMAVIEGPADTVYEGGTFFVDIIIPKSYPFEPPQLIFRTRIYHPNINSNGAICLSTIFNEWKPEMTLLNVFEALISLLYIYDLEEPLIPSIAKLFKEDPKEFERIARLWTQRYSICTFKA